jgi:hypothetical protein
MYRNFTYEVLGQRRKLKAIKKILTEFFKYFFRVLHEARSSRLKFVHVFQKHLYVKHTGCLKIREFRIQSMVGKDPVELEKFFEKNIRSEEDISTLILFNIYLAAFISTVTKCYSSYVAV